VRPELELASVELRCACVAMGQLIASSSLWEYLKVEKFRRLKQNKEKSTRVPPTRVSPRLLWALAVCPKEHSKATTCAKTDPLRGKQNGLESVRLFRGTVSPTDTPALGNQLAAAHCPPSASAKCLHCKQVPQSSPNGHQNHLVCGRVRLSQVYLACRIETSSKGLFVFVSAASYRLIIVAKLEASIGRTSLNQKVG